MWMPPLPAEQIASAIDHTLLDTGCGPDAIEALCDQAAVHGFAAVCVYPWWAGLARARLAGAAAVCTVVSFPHGLDRTEAKCDAAGAAIAEGTVEAVAAMRRALPERVAIKASGGIRTAAAASAMLEAGAVRIGTSSGVAILGELEAHAVA